MLHPLFIAKRYAWRQEKKSWAYRLSRLTCCCTALSTSVLLLAAGTTNGAARLLDVLFYAPAPLLQIVPKAGKTFLEDRLLRAKVAQLPSVQAVVDHLEARVLLSGNGIPTLARLRAITPAFVRSAWHTQCRRIDWDPTTFFQSGTNPRGVLASEGLARRIQAAGGGAPFLLLHPRHQGSSLSLGRLYRQRRATLCGQFVSQFPQDEALLLAPIDLVEQLTDRTHHRTAWELVLPAGAVAQTQAAIQRFLPDHLAVATGSSQNTPRQKALSLERLCTRIVFGFVALLSCLHLFFTLCILTLEKRKDLATLAAMGATSNQIERTFVCTGLWIAAEGACYGMAAAWLLGKGQEAFGLLTLCTLPNQGAVPYPMELRALDFCCVAAGTLLAAGAAALWPAKQAARVAYATQSHATKL